jgi:hypothetical protein
MPTVLTAAAQAFSLAPRRTPSRWLVEERPPTEPWPILYTGVFIADTSMVTPNRISAGALLSRPRGPGERSVLAGRIVLIGGTYYAGRDLEVTPVGNMPGVYIWAEAIASWMRGDAPQIPRAPINFTLQFLIGVIAAWLLVRFGLRFGVLYIVLLEVPLAVIFSLLTLGNRIGFTGFLPPAFGVVISYVLEIELERRKLLHRLRTMGSRERAGKHCSDPGQAAGLDLMATSVRAAPSPTSPSIPAVPPATMASNEPPPPHEGPGEYVFVSYKRDDMDRIAPYLHWLGDWGYYFWYDGGIRASAVWAEVLSEKLKGCQALVVFLSQAAIDSKWVLNEVGLAYKEGKAIIPVELEKVELRRGFDLLLCQIQIIDAGAPGIDQELRRAMEYIRRS